tara:strand:- start:266 stop:514 length:249 start_codon:yes stop_codon:yes gene_type:complete
LKDWLERQAEKEELLLDAASDQFRVLLDGLLPQVRLAALENDMEAVTEVITTFNFEENAITLTMEGRVEFPAKVTEVDSITI